MADQLTKANINLFAVLRNMEDLCELDEDVKSLVGDKDISIGFLVRYGPSGLLKFKGGRCSFSKDTGPCSVKLFFKSPQHFNDMFNGNANPIPLKGFTRLGFLKNEFTKLTEKLSFYLKPTDELLKDNKYFTANTYLAAYTAFFALSEIGNSDRIGRMNASRISDGVISICVINGPSIHIEARDGMLKTGKGPGDKPRASMVFDSLETANALLNGKMDSYTCMGTGRLQVKGYIPMIDNMNKLLAMVPFYLK